MEQYNALWEKDQKIIFDLGNIVNDICESAFSACRFLFCHDFRSFTPSGMSSDLKSSFKRYADSKIDTGPYYTDVS